MSQERSIVHILLIMWMCFFVQPYVPRSEGQCFWSGPKLHVFFPTGLCAGRRLPLEVCERGVGGGWPGGGPRRGSPQSRWNLHPPWLTKLWCSLDEGGRDLQQSETHQQGQRRRTGTVHSHLYYTQLSQTFTLVLIDTVTCFITAKVIRWW